MTDIFQEVSEDMRREKAQKLWSKYGNYVLGAALAVVVGVSGYVAYQHYQKQQAEATGARFQQAISLAQSGKTKEAAAALSTLVKDGSAGYQTLARFRLAAETASDKVEDGIKAYDALAADSSLGPVLQSLAKVRGGYLLVDTASYADLAGKIEPLTAANEPWRHSAREVLGLAAWKAKDLANASKWYQAVITDKDVPQALRQRAELMLQLIASDQPAKA
ncbi:tetratricopeptide repeat protein [Labrys neptuniae]